jgi:hypothetical protein
MPRRRRDEADEARRGDVETPTEAREDPDKAEAPEGNQSAMAGRENPDA